MFCKSPKRIGLATGLPPTKLFAKIQNQTPNKTKPQIIFDKTPKIVLRAHYNPTKGDLE
jgi:hypothetical protein